MGTKNRPGEFDCHAAADPDEPLFILRANDPKSAPLIRMWIEMYKLEKAPIMDDPNTTMEERSRIVRKMNEAEQCADDMNSWRYFNQIRKRAADEEESSE